MILGSFINWTTGNAIFFIFHKECSFSLENFGPGVGYLFLIDQGPSAPSVLGWVFKDQPIFQINCIPAEVSVCQNKLTCGSVFWHKSACVD